MNFKKIATIIILVILLVNSVFNLVIAVTIEDTNTLVAENDSTNLIENDDINTIESDSINKSEEKNETSNTLSSEINGNIIEDTTIIENTENENANTSDIDTIKDGNIEIVSDDNSKVNPEIKKLLNMSNINDISVLSTKVTQEQFEQVFLSIQNNSIQTNSTYSNNLGIWINENDRELIKNFINNHSSYTYSINNGGYLVCDKILRVNEVLELIEPQETEMDIAINNVLSENKKIMLKVTDSYYNFNESNAIESKLFDDDVKSKAYEYDGTRIIFLNSKFYNTNEINYNLVLSDDFIKVLDDIQYKVLIGEIQLGKELINTNESGITTYNFTDNGQCYGSAKLSQIVYHGPNDNGSYCKVGSISRNETIAILGSEGDYYHILYAVSNSSNEKTGYVLKSNISASRSVSEEIMTGGYRYANQGVDIKSRGLYSVSVSYGSLSNTEGATLLYDYRMNYGSEQYQVGFVEYWTGNGMKRGYVKMEYLSSPYKTTIAKADSKKTTYTGPDSSRFTSGTGAIGANEYVCVLGYTGNYVYIEYNTNTGRRRAFCNQSDLNISTPSSLGIPKLPDLQMSQGYLSNSKQDVSAGPGKAKSLCAYVGAIGEKESVYRQTTNGTNPYNQLGYTYIVYYAGESLKGGFVPESTLTIGKNPSIPDLPASVGKDGGFKEAQYWQSGLGNPIRSYKLGNGNKRLYLIYAQHGFEDEGYGDGVEVVDIAYKFMGYMYNCKDDSNVQNILSDWTIYMVPYLNRDGIESGSSENGPGRCNIKNEIDINRNWPTAVYKDYPKGRNYTGSKPLQTVEAQGLRDMLNKNDVKPVSGYTSVLIDIHGWDCETIGSSEVGSYYLEQFKEDSNTHFLSHNGGHSFQSRGLTSGTASSGYLAQWAVENGIDQSIILELPSHTSRKEGNRSLSDRFNTATINLLSKM